MLYPPNRIRPKVNHIKGLIEYFPLRGEKVRKGKGVFYYFEWFLQEYESRFEKDYGYVRPEIQDVLEETEELFDQAKKQ